MRLKVEARHAPGRIKQWLHLLARNYAGAQNLFAEIRGLRTLDEVDQVLAVMARLPARSPSAPAAERGAWPPPSRWRTSCSAAARELRRLSVAARMSPRRQGKNLQTR